MTDRLRWPVIVTTTTVHRVWVYGDDSADAAADLNRDACYCHEVAERDGEVVGGGCHATVPDEFDEVYDSYVDFGPRLPDGSFWGPGERASWVRSEVPA